ncbi:hypothetical protein, partial [Actinophytocola sp.]|uniref:hypothetical protein n=1 Tax=Actinophytocola sp. TaxID=1872138 RepID=UPI00389A5391
AVEAYYYPKYLTGNAQQATLIAKRSIPSTFQSLWADHGGGVAARDYDSWDQCTETASGAMACQNTVPYPNNPLDWVWWAGTAAPTQPQWSATYYTHPAETDALHTDSAE